MMTIKMDDKQQIEKIVDQYRHSFTTIDMELLKSLWDLDYSNIIYIPQERTQPLRNRTELEEYFRHIDGAFKRVIKMSINDLSIDIFEQAAYTFFTYHFEANIEGKNIPFTVDGRITLILHRKDGNWKIIHYHESPVDLIKAAKLKASR